MHDQLSDNERCRIMMTKLMRALSDAEQRGESPDVLEYLNVLISSWRRALKRTKGESNA